MKNRSILGIVAAGTFTVLAASFFNLFETNNDIECDDVDDVEENTTDNGVSEEEGDPDASDSTSAEEASDELSDNVAELFSKISDLRTAINMLTHNQSVFGKTTDDISETVSLLEEAVKEIEEDLGNSLTEGKDRETRLQKFEKSLNDLTASVSNIQPVTITVSPDAVPDPEKDGEILNALNAAIQDTHQRQGIVEGAIRQSAERMSDLEEDVNAVKEFSAETEKALDEFAKALASTTEMIEALRQDLVQVSSKETEPDPEESVGA